MSEWPLVRLGELIHVEHGWAFPGVGFSEPTGRHPRIVKIGDFALPYGSQLKTETMREFVGDYPRQFELRPGDVLIAMTCQTRSGEILGIPMRVPDDERTYLHNQRLGKVVLRRPDIVDISYLYFLFLSRVFNDHLVATASGSAILHTAPDRIESFGFRLPSLPEQRAIAEVLGALDDKIEANRRAQNRAESIARAHLAQAQQGGAEAAVPIRSLVERVTQIVQPAELAENDVYVGLEHMPRGSLLLKEHGGTQSLASAKAAFQPKDVLFGKLRPYFKKVVVAPTPGVCSTDILVLRPKVGEWAVAAAVCASDDVIDYASGGSEGTRMPRVSWDYLARYEVPLPGPDARQRLEARIAPLLQFGMRLTVESRALATLRDALLPKLLSGELHIRDTEHLIEETV